MNTNGFRTLKWTMDSGLATIRLAREHGNAINDELVRELVTVLQLAEADPQVRGVLLAATGKLFCPGLDLQELIRLDRNEMSAFLERFNACLLVLYTFPKPLVAAMHGHAIAGGCVLGLTADWRVLQRGALVGLNEVRVGVPFPFGVSMILRESVPRARLEEIALFGRNYCDEAAVSCGLVHEIADPAAFDDRCRQRLAELAEKDGASFSITKRYLRSSTVERIRAHDSQFKHEFLRVWFSDATRRRLGAIVETLEHKRLR